MADVHTPSFRSSRKIVQQTILRARGTLAAVVDKLNRELNEVLKSAELAPTLAQLGYETKITTSAEFAAFFAAELRKLPPVLTTSGVNPQ